MGEQIDIAVDLGVVPPPLPELELLRDFVADLPEPPPQLIEGILHKAMLARHGLELSQLRRFVAGADVFSRQSDGTTIAQHYLREGIKLRPANTDRVNGWAEILQRLGDGEAKILPSLFIHQRCGRLVETLPAMQHDPRRPEDVLKVDCDEEGVGGDDATDCLRHLVATKSRAVAQRKLRGL